MSVLEIPGGLLDQVLERLGFATRPGADLEGLRQLYGAWCRKVPFDNSRKLIAVRSGIGGPLPGDAPVDFFEAWLTHGAGGTCWAGNGALCELLRALGFDAVRGVATMVVAPDLPPNHGTVLVGLPEGQYMVDASVMFVEPLLVIPGVDSAIAQPAWGVQGRWSDEKFLVRWRSMQRDDPFDCRLDEWPVAPERYRQQHEATRQWSPFNFELNMNLVRGEERIGIALNHAVCINAGGRVVREPLVDRVAYLVEEMGLSEALATQIRPDVPTPPPPGSRTSVRSQE